MTVGAPDPDDARWAQRIGVKPPVAAAHIAVPGTGFFHPNVNSGIAGGAFITARHEHVIKEDWNHDVKMAVAKHIEQSHFRSNK